MAVGVAGAVSRSLTAPVDRLKMLLQVQDIGSPLTIRQGIRQMAAEGTAFSADTLLQALARSPVCSMLNALLNGMTSKHVDFETYF